MSAEPRRARATLRRPNSGNLRLFLLQVLLDDTLKEGTMQGRNFAYRPIVVDGTFELGSKVKVKITSATPFDIRGEVVKEITCEQ